MYGWREHNLNSKFSCRQDTPDTQRISVKFESQKSDRELLLYVVREGVSECTRLFIAGRIEFAIPANGIEEAETLGFTIRDAHTKIRDDINLHKRCHFFLNAKKYKRILRKNS